MLLLFVVAGLNGSGRFSLTRSGRFAPVPVSDPDAIARGPPLGTAQPIAAGREALRRQRAMLEAGTSFAVETTLAGRSTLNLMRLGRAGGLAAEPH